MVNIDLEVPRVVCYKKILMTGGEYDEFKKICDSYTTPLRKGEILFKDTFEVNSDGRIVYLKALGAKETSFEIVMFLMALMQNQWLRMAMREVNIEIKKIKVKGKELDDKIAEIDQRIAILDNRIPVKIKKSR